MNISFFGLSHLGLNYLAASAAKGFKVIGYDENKELIERLKLKKKIFNEPFLFENLKKYKKNITFTSNVNDLKKSKIIFISSDIDTNKNGKSDLKKIKKSIRVIKSKLSNKNLIIMSQVKPGFTKKIVWNKSKLFYQVETLIFGEAFKRALNPERIILGVDNSLKKINSEVRKFYKKFKCPIIKTDFNTAEIIKISINVYLISSITTTNLLAKIVKKMKGNWIDLENALRLDKRIGKYAYLRPGNAFSGGTLARDLNFLIKVGKKFETNHQLIKSVNKSNAVHSRFLENILYKNINSKKTKILQIGLSYKKNTSTVRRSIPYKLFNSLKNKYYIKVYDKYLINHKKEVLHLSKYFLSRLSKEKFDLILIFSKIDNFKKIKGNFKNNAKIIDFEGSNKKSILSKNLSYISLENE